MDSNNIKNFGMNDLHREGWDVYSDEHLVIVSDCKDIPLRRGTLNVDMPIISYCSAGTTSCVVNGKPYTISHGDVVIFMPPFLVEQKETSADFECRLIGFSSQSLKSHALHTGKDLFDLMEYKKEHPVVFLDHDEQNTYFHFYELIRLNVRRRGTPFYSETMNALFQAIFCETCAVVSRRLPPSEYLPRGIRRKDWLFKNFLRVLMDSGGRVRSVTGIAETLGVTSKYLSSVVKEVSDRTALDWIQDYTTEVVTRELKYTDKSIKEISLQLGFPSLSFFGKFCKSRLGQSPKEFRRSSIAAANGGK